MNRYLKMAVLLLTWVILLYSRTQSHAQVMSFAWIVWLVIAHALSVSIGFVLRGFFR